MDIFYDGIGDRIRHLRAKKGLSRQQLAEQTGISWQQLQMIEQSHRCPSEDAIDRIAAVLGEDGGWLRKEHRR